jgi:hypothetical protein
MTCRDLVGLLGGAVSGIHSMTDEHFGISVVEYMAAGAIPIGMCDISFFFSFDGCVIKVKPLHKYTLFSLYPVIMHVLTYIDYFCIVCLLFSS